MSGKRPAETIQTLLEAESEAKLVVEKARKGTHRAPLVWAMGRRVVPRWLAIRSLPRAQYNVVGGGNAWAGVGDALHPQRLLRVVVFVWRG